VCKLQNNCSCLPRKQDPSSSDGKACRILIQHELVQQVNTFRTLSPYDWVERALLRAHKARQCPVFLLFITNWANDFTLGAYNLTAAILSRQDTQRHTTTVLRPLYEPTCVSRHLRLRTGGFCRCKDYCPHAFADGNQRTRIREKTLEFSRTVSSTLSSYVYL